MSEYLRPFIGSTELTYSELSIDTSSDYIIDSAKVVTKGVTTTVIGSVLDIRKADGITSVFNGRINNINKDTTWELEVLGNGYELNNLYIQTVWENESPEGIIADVIDTYTENLTYTGTAVSGVTISRYIGNAYAIDIIKDMLDVLRWEITINSSDEVNISPANTINNGKTFTNGDNVNLLGWKEDNNNMFNRVRIKGGFESFALAETTNATTTTFTLDKKPQGTMRVLVSGIEIDPANYDVDAENKTIIFTSNQTNPTFEYSYNRPVVAEDQDDDSINTYGEIFREVPAPWLTSTSAARKYGAGLIDAYSGPLLSVKAFRGGINYDIVLGETVRVIDNVRGYNELMTVDGITYTGGGTTVYSLGSESIYFNEWQREVQDRIKKLERRFSNQEDIVFSRRLKHDMVVTLSATTTWEQANPQDTFWLNHTTLGQLRTVVNGHIENFEADCSANSNYGTWYGSNIDGAQYNNNLVVGLEDFWNFQGNYDNDVGTNTLTLTGNQILSADSNGSTDCAYYFPGDVSYFSKSNYAYITPSGTYTVAGWIKWNGGVGDGRSYQNVWINGASASDRNSVKITESGNIIFSSFNGSVYNSVLRPTLLTAGTWYHFAAVQSSGSKTLYVNGTPYTTSAGNSYVAGMAGDFYLSFPVENGTGGYGSFNGSLSKIGVWNVALTQDQVTMLAKETYASGYPFANGERLSYGTFNGTDNYVEADSVGSLQTGSICAWVYPRSTNSAYIAGNVFANADRLILGVNSGTFAMNRYDGSSNGRNSSSFTANQWYHVACTTDGSTQNIYVNGVLDNQGTSIAFSSSILDNLRIGARDDDTEFFDGLIDEVMFFDTELSVETINEIMNNNFYSNHDEYSDCVAWYSFDNPRLGIRIGGRVTI